MIIVSLIGLAVVTSIVYIYDASLKHDEMIAKYINKHP